MAVTLTEVLNNLASKDPMLYRALVAVLPVIRLVSIGTPAAVPTVSTLAHTVTVNGVSVGDAVVAIKPTEQTGISVTHARVSAANTVIITFVNPTAGNITPTASEIYKIVHFPAQASPLTNAIP
jgi:hypothetical protein